MPLSVHSLLLLIVDPELLDHNDASGSNLALLPNKIGYQCACIPSPPGNKGEAFQIQPVQN